MVEFNDYMQMLKHKLYDVEINIKNFIIIVRFAMEVVEITELKGHAQKDLLIRLVRTIIVEAPITDDKEKLMLDMIDNDVLGNTVDLVVDASKGNLNINNVVEIATGCCTLL
tara:strand:- start:1376 stop:1711 length:336 start_codon:yes stop_codon:yes gene_type:complete